MKKALEQTGRYTVILTRDKDVFISLRDRYRFAHEAEADLFISIHADAIRVNTVRGLTVYTLSERASDRESELLAEQENRSDLVAGHDLSHYSKEVSSILLDLTRSSTNQQSWTAAETFVLHARRRVPVARKPHRSAGFVVLKSPSVPSILLELGYLTNRSDVRNLQSKTFKSQVGELMTAALDEYFREREKSSPIAVREMERLVGPVRP